MPVYAVTWASGHLGRFAIEQLLARGVPPSHIVAVVRNLGKATRLAGRGVQVREADYLRPEDTGRGAGRRQPAAAGLQQRTRPTGRPAHQRHHGRADGRGLTHRVPEHA